MGTSQSSSPKNVTTPYGHLAKFEPQTKLYHMGTSQSSSPQMNRTLYLKNERKNDKEFCILRTLFTNKALTARIFYCEYSFHVSHAKKF